MVARYKKPGTSSKNQKIKKKRNGMDAKIRKIEKINHKEGKELKQLEKMDKVQDKKLDKYKKTNGSNIIPPETINRIRLELQNRVLEREGMLETAKNFNPEEDKDDQVMRKKALEDLKDAIKEQAVAKKEIIEDKKKIQEVIQLRQSNRLQQKKAAVPPPAPALAPKGARKGEKKK
jgi:hypothetical protein